MTIFSVFGFLENRCSRKHLPMGGRFPSKVNLCLIQQITEKQVPLFVEKTPVYLLETLARRSIV